MRPFCSVKAVIDPNYYHAFAHSFAGLYCSYIPANYCNGTWKWFKTWCISLRVCILLSCWALCLFFGGSYTKTLSFCPIKDGIFSSPTQNGILCRPDKNGIFVRGGSYTKWYFVYAYKKWNFVYPGHRGGSDTKTLSFCPAAPGHRGGLKTKLFCRFLVFQTT